MLYVLLEPARLGEDFWKHAWPALSADRQRKVRRFSFARDKVLSAAAFLLLRLGLRREYGITAMPACGVAAGGKPFLLDGTAHFSLSHCRQAVVCALGKTPLGADVEPWSSFTPQLFGPSMQARIFAPEEQESVRQAPCQELAACALWVAKESVCKCTGQGIDDTMPFLLRRTDMRVDSYTFPAQKISAAVCRHAHDNAAPLACHEISPEAMRHFLQELLTPAAAGATFPHNP